MTRRLGEALASNLQLDRERIPRTTIDLGDQIEYLSILDERGAVHRDLVPDLNEDTLRRMHRMMQLSRRFDERLLRLHGQGRIGTFAQVSGQEGLRSAP